jgi:uncharacterized protein YycO
MAEILTAAALAKLPASEYETVVRPQLRPGDLMFASGRYLVSRAIQVATGSAWSHVGVIFPLPSVDRVLLLESVEDMGVRFAPLSKYLYDYENGQRYRGEIVIARCHGFDPAALAKLAGFGIDELTRPYDRDEIAKIVARIALGKGRSKRDREYICSELVWECFDRAGKTFRYNEKGFVSPEDLWRDDSVELLHRVRFPAV